MFSNFFRKSCRLWYNMEKYGTARQTTDDNIMRRMRFAYWVTNTTLHYTTLHYTTLHTNTQTNSEYVILTTFPLQKWLHERASLLRYTCTAYLITLILQTKKCTSMQCYKSIMIFSHAWIWTIINRVSCLDVKVDNDCIQLLLDF
jgi:hypothetical protein